MYETAVHVSRLCAETWRDHALPAAVAARELLVEARGILEERRDTGYALPESGLQLITLRLGELEQALERMLAWTDEWSRVPSASDARAGITAFERWYQAYHAAVAAVILCDACRQLRLDGTRLAAPYARWKKRHQALRTALVGSLNGEQARAGPLAGQLPHYLSSMDSPEGAASMEAEGEHMPCFLNGARTHFIREALRSLDDALAEEVRVSPVREALERLRSSDRLSQAQLEILESFVAELTCATDSGSAWHLQQRLKSIERDLAAH